MSDERLKELLLKLIRGEEMMVRYEWEELIKLYPRLEQIINSHDPLVEALSTAIAFAARGASLAVKHGYIDEMSEFKEVGAELNKTLAEAKGANEDEAIPI